jgi:hypothetical protein
MAVDLETEFDTVDNTDETTAAATDTDSLDDVAPGVLTAVDVFDSPCFTEDPTSDNPLTGTEKRSMQSLVEVCMQSDVAARRIQVEQVWQARLFQRGYQYLSARRGGGWELPGQGSRIGVAATADAAGLSETNIYGQNFDIIVAALASDTPRIQFSPNSDSGPDTTAADAANKYKLVWSKQNDLQARMADIASYFFTDGMAVLFTRSVANAQEFGYVNPSVDDEPVVPETEEDNVPDTDGDPRIRSITTVFGALEAKTPVTAQRLCDMQFVQLFEEVDESTAKSRFPWIADKIKASGSGISEVEIDRIARLSSKLSLPGSYVAGDSLIRDVTISYSFIRPSLYMDDACKGVRKSFLSKFKKGILIVKAGTEFACAYNVSMDDHLAVIHALPGSGQNRRAIGSNLMSVQKRLNTLVDLQMKFYTATVPHKYYDNEVFDLESIRAQSNEPGAAHPFQRVANVPFAELMGTDPAVSQQPGMTQFLQWMATQLPEQLGGAIPALFGGSDNPNTVGAYAMQRAQALQRIGTPWKSAKSGIAKACWQAVQCSAANGNDTIADTLPGEGRIAIECADLRGNVLCYPEDDADFPESHDQREQRFAELVNNAANPFYAKLLAIPKNAKVAKDALRMVDLEVPGAASVEKQQAEFEVLLKTGPVPNPQLAQQQQKLSEGQQILAADNAKGIPVLPEMQQALQALQQSIQSLPPEVSTVTVEQDASEDHATEANVCWEWMNGADGRSYKNGDELQRAAFQNVKIHWQEHTAMAQKLAPPTPMPPVKVNVAIDPSKLPGPEAAQLLGELGIKSDPQNFNEDQTHEQTQEVEQSTPTGTVKQKISIAGAPLK